MSALREGWLVLVSREGVEVSTRIPVVVDENGRHITHPGQPVRVHHPTEAWAVRFINSRGRASDRPLIRELAL